MIELYTANHPIKTGISDVVKVLLLAGESHNVHISVSDKLTSPVVIFIDEFSSKSELRCLLAKKNANKLRYVLLSTEFETSGAMGDSFNEFSSVNKYQAILVSCASLLLYWTPKRLRNGKIFGKFSALVGLFILLPTFLSFPSFTWRSIVENIRALRRAVYLKARRRGYDEFKRHADMVVKIHERLTDTRIEDVLYPVLSKAPELASQKIKVSGTQTQYRIEMCNIFLRHLVSKNEAYVFEYDGSIKFSDHNTDDVYGFAYQPAQSLSWDKSNPIKIWRDYYFYGALPIVDKKFNDHPIEGIAITTKQFFAGEFDRKLVHASFDEYNKLVFANNRTIFSGMLALLDDK